MTGAAVLSCIGLSVLCCVRSMRHQVDQLLLALWADPACKTSLSAVAQAANAGTGGAASEHLVEYARAVLNNLMYTLKVSKPYISPRSCRAYLAPVGRTPCTSCAPHMH